VIGGPLAVAASQLGVTAGSLDVGEPAVSCPEDRRADDRGGLEVGERLVDPTRFDEGLGAPEPRGRDRAVLGAVGLEPQLEGPAVTGQISCWQSV